MPKKALVVDSDYFFVEFLSELLTKRGYQVLKAYNGKEGIAKLKDESIRILFADLVLPKVDGRQLFEFIRKKYNGNRFPVVALSGIMIEQLGSLHEIGADYFIAKGPIDKLTLTLNEFMAEMETRPFFPPAEKEVLATGNVFPRRDAVELFNSLMFHQAIIDCAAVGIVTVDDDTRIMNANRAALQIIGKSAVDVLNTPVADLFVDGKRDEIADALIRVKHQKELGKASICVAFQSQAINAIVSSFDYKGNHAGWVLVLEPAQQGTG